MNRVNIVLLYILSLATISCGYDSFKEMELSKQQWSTTHRISELESSPYSIQKDVIIEGVVVANDSSGNFYQEFYLQQADTTGNNSGYSSLRVRINYFDSYIDFPLGATIALNLKGLVVRRVDDALVVGIQANDISSIPELIPTRMITLSQTNYQLNSLQIAPLRLKIEDIEAKHIGQLLSLDSLYFSEQLGVYSGERELKEVGGDNKIMLYTSPYSDLATEGVENGIISIEAIVVQRDKKLQLMVNSLDKITKL